MLKKNLANHIGAPSAFRLRFGGAGKLGLGIAHPDAKIGIIRAYRAGRGIDIHGGGDTEAHDLLDLRLVGNAVLIALQDKLHCRLVARADYDRCAEFDDIRHKFADDRDRESGLKKNVIDNALQPLRPLRRKRYPIVIDLLLVRLERRVGVFGNLFRGGRAVRLRQLQALGGVLHDDARLHIGRQHGVGAVRQPPGLVTDLPEHPVEDGHDLHELDAGKRVVGLGKHTHRLKQADVFGRWLSRPCL